jgi:hypothetical protein
VQGQLRLLQQSFTTAALPEATRQKLIELTQTAAVKAEGLTKKTGKTGLSAASSAPSPRALNPAQAADVLKLVKAAFGGLFLHWSAQCGGLGRLFVSQQEIPYQAR